MAEAALPPRAAPRQAHLARPLVWLASYPKSGNTWTRILLANFLRESVDDDAQEDRIALTGSISSDRVLFDNATGLPSSDLTAAEIDLLRPGAYRAMAAGRDGARFIKAHDAYQLNAAGEPIFPAEATRGAVLLVRHPMDVAVSFAHHVGAESMAFMVRSLGNPEHVMAGEGKRQIHQRTGGWSGHYLSWTRQDAIPLIVVRYEDMLADTAAQLVRILDFLGIPGSGDRARIDRAVALSRFDRLQELETREGFAEIPVKAQRFFRSGRAGEGIEQLPPRLRQRILDEHGPVMAELGYSHLGADSL
jgi:hypothetical protein